MCITVVNKYFNYFWGQIFSKIDFALLKIKHSKWFLNIIWRKLCILIPGYRKFNKVYTGFCIVYLIYLEFRVHLLLKKELYFEVCNYLHSTRSATRINLVVAEKNFCTCWGSDYSGRRRKLPDFKFLVAMGTTGLSGCRLVHMHT